MKGILRAHGATIAVESAPGNGTKFTVLIPAAESLAESPDSVPCIQEKGFSGCALAVDDEAAVLGVASRMLARLGYGVVAVNDGEGAIGSIDDQEFDVVLLDVAMPGMSGIEAFRHIRARRPGLPVVLMSGYTFQELPEDVANDPRLTFIQKPFTFVSLSSAISAVAAPGHVTD